MDGTTQAITEIIDNYVDIESQEKNRKTSQVSNFTLKDSIRQIVKLQKTTVLLIVIIILSATELLRLLIVQKWYNLHWRKLSSRRRNFIVQTKIFIPKIGLFYSIFDFVQNAKSWSLLKLHSGKSNHETSFRHTCTYVCKVHHWAIVLHIFGAKYFCANIFGAYQKSVYQKVCTCTYCSNCILPNVILHLHLKK